MRMQLKTAGKVLVKNVQIFLKTITESCFVSSTSNIVEWIKWKDFDGKLSKVVEEGSIKDVGGYIDSMKKDFFFSLFHKNRASYCIPIAERTSRPKKIIGLYMSRP